jgi:hypothetical protein
MTVLLTASGARIGDQHGQVEHPDAVLDEHTSIPPGKMPFAADPAAFSERARWL